MPISGKGMLKHFQKYGWSILRQKGSHVVVRKNKYRETIPMHKELRKGLEMKLYKILKRGDD